MSRDTRRSYSTFDPHGYQPLVVDEDCLCDKDRREAVLEAVAHPRDWMRYLTPKELVDLQQALEEAEKQPRNYYSIGESSETREKRFEAARLGMFRAFARDKYAGGRRIWYGDGIPWRQHES